MSGLHVAELELSHFRSYRSARLALDGRPVALWGPNGAGKTNILEAVSLLSPGRGLRRAPPADLPRRPDEIGWKIAAALVRAEAPAHEIALRALPGQSREVRIDGKAAPQVALGRLAPIVWLVPAMDRLWIEGADGRRRFLDRIAMSFEPDHAEAVLGYDKAMRERNRLLKDMVRDDRWYAALERRMAETGARIAATRRGAIARLGRAQDGAATSFPAAGLSITHPEDAAGESVDDLLAAFAAMRAADMRAGRTLAGPHRADLGAVFLAKGVPAAQCSTGEQKALLVSLVLANARALSEDRGTPPVILLDEVAAHLDAARRAALYDEIAALGAQAWMTGTGAELFAELGPRAQGFEVTERAGESLATEVAP